ncbi:glycosyltransferase family 4 protein [Roseibium sp.]|uniref:glycosyltransferase family 4 protein n=1 Tax=Roseibium sp. TaxID=1936156 RepID=UPI003A97087F
MFSQVNIVHVVRQFAPMVGGLEDFVRNLAIRQLGRFASVRVVTLDRLFTNLETYLPANGIVDGVAVERIPFWGSTRYPIAPSVFRHLGPADIVHVHAVDFFFDALALTRLVHRKPIVATTHGGFFHTRNHSALKKVWFNTLTRFSADGYGAIACCSESDLELFSKIAPNKARLIENGVDLEKFCNSSSETAQKRLVTIGRFSKNKGLDKLLDTLARLVSDDPAWQLDVIGSPSDLSQDDLVGLIEARGLTGHVQLRIGVSDADVRKVLGQCSLFVSASKYEGFGIAMIEAMSAGLVPVVHPNAAFTSLATRHPMIKLVDFDRPGDAAAAISERFVHIAATPVVRDQVILSSRQHGWSATSDAYDQMYRDVLA